MIFIVLHFVREQINYMYCKTKKIHAESISWMNVTQARSWIYILNKLLILFIKEWI